jgi:hypothetical protein
MLSEVNYDEMEAQMLMNSTESPTAMDASHLEHEPERNDFLCFHVQMCSIMLHDDELITRKCLGLKNFGKSLRGKFCDFLESGSEVCFLM